MAAIHLTRIKSAMQKLFQGHIDMSDYDARPDLEKNKAFLSRALAAYPLTLLCELDASAAGRMVTDGFDDNGIDAAYFDESRDTLYLVQSKWNEAGRGSINRGQSGKFLTGCRDLVNLRFERFNDRMRAHEKVIRPAMLDANVRIVLVVAYSGTGRLSPHVKQDMEDFLGEMNDPVELFSSEVFDQLAVYNGIAGHAQRHSINLEIVLSQWGHIEAPYVAYYGRVNAVSVAEWWREHSRNLLVRNIRNFKGRTDVNDALASTLKTAPTDFWYFNNGITMLCRSIAKKPVGGGSRETGVFECEGVTIVNGAQTVGMIGAVAESPGLKPDTAQVAVRLISLENCPSGFDKSVTRATNTQNRIERRDFAALDPNQARLASELLLDHKHYSYKSGDAEAKGDDGCTIMDATVALACASGDLALAVQAKREIGRLWEDIERPPYTTLFNDKTDAVQLWRAVEIMRAVDAALIELARSNRPRADLVAVHGNRMILYRVFAHPRVAAFRDPAKDLDQAKKEAVSVTGLVFRAVVDHLEAVYPNQYLASLFKNAKRCREVDAHLADLLPRLKGKEYTEQPGLFPE